jgi:enamine deaminase RidA (YjgF/YER057c/UK114 family)
MKRKNIQSDGEFENTFGYRRAVRVGDQIHVAGTCAQPPHENGDAYEQVKGALGIIEKALGEAGASFEHVVRTVVYITDTKHADGVTRAHSEAFDQIRPASTMVVVAELLKPNLVVEIEAYALMG